MCHQSVATYATGRYGKTSLVKAAHSHAYAAGLTTVYVNFLGVVTAQDVVDRIDRAYSDQLEGPLRSFWKAFQATLSAAPGGVGVALTPRTSDPGLLERLDLPRKISERTGTRVAVAFDEFQEVARVNDALPGTFRSVIEQHGDAVSYAFSGSHPGMMRELFASQKHAFFAQATPIELGRLDAAETITAIAQRFASHDRDAGEALDVLVATIDGHPQRTMLLAHYLFEATPSGATAGGQQWLDALAHAQRHANDEIRSAWDALGETERRVASAVAVATIPLQGQIAARTFGISRGSGTTKAARGLTNLGILQESESAAAGYRITDPLFALWLRSGRRWPD